MSAISVTSEAGLDIVRRLASGELEVHGILLRDTAQKRFRYILRGLEGIPVGDGSDLSPLDPLRTAISLDRLLGMVSIAQNAAIAVSLRRIEAQLSAIDRRLHAIDDRLKRVETDVQLLLKGMRNSPVNCLRTAQNAAATALEKNDATAMIAAAMGAEHAARDLLGQSLHLVHVELDGLPVALKCPTELADLVDATVAGMRAASAMHLAQDARGVAGGLAHEVAGSFAAIRATLARRLTDPELMLRRAAFDLAPPAELTHAAARLRAGEHWSRARAVLIETGIIGPDPRRLELERAEPASGIQMLPLPEMTDDRCAADRL